MKLMIPLSLILALCACNKEQPEADSNGDGCTEYEACGDGCGCAEEEEPPPDPQPEPPRPTNIHMQYTPRQVAPMLERLESDDKKQRGMAISSLPSDPKHFEKHPELLGKVRDALVEVAKSDSEDMNRAFAIGKLCGMKEHAKPALPTLIKLLEHEKDCQHVCHNLRHMGATGHAAIPRMVELLKTGPEQNKIFLMDGLGRMDPDAAAAAIPALTEVLKSHPKPFTRLKAARALGNFGARANSALPTLDELAKSGPGNLKFACKDAAAKIRKG